MTSLKVSAIPFFHNPTSIICLDCIRGHGLKGEDGERNWNNMEMSAIGHTVSIMVNVGSSSHTGWTSNAPFCHGGNNT